MNSELIKNTKNDFEKDFSKFLNNGAFWKTTEKVKNYRNIMIAHNNHVTTNIILIITTEAIRNYLFSEPNYNSIKWFFR